MKDLYGINEAANTLSTLIKTNSEQKEEIELWVSNKKAEWVKENDLLSKEHEENKKRVEALRHREEEEYRYNTDLRRKKDIDEYNNKKLILEQDLSKMKESLLLREDDVAKKEQLYNELQLQVQKIPEDIKAAIVVAENNLRIQLEREYQFSSELKQKEFESKLKLYEQTTANLEDKIKTQNTLIKELTDKADMAIKQVESIACKALDVVSSKYIQPGIEKEKSV